MSEKRKIILIITALFLVFGGLLFYFDLLQSGAGETAKQLPFHLFSACLLILLLLAVLGLVQSQFKKMDQLAEDYKRSLNQKINELKEAQTGLEEMVEKRTFEISVINASLNREIAERIQAETESNKLKNRFQLILDSAGEGIFGLDKEGNVMFINKAASLMLGWETEDLIGKSHHELVHHTHPDGTPHPVEDCPIHEAYREGIVHARSDDVFWTKSGTSFPVEYYSTPIMENKKIVGAVVVFRDMNTFK